MTKARLEAFSDGVVAILITIMVLELKVPAPGHDGWDALLMKSADGGPSPVATLLTYALSFISLAIYWNNHHHMLHASTKVNGTVLWANTHLLFWLSLIPYTTAWMQDEHFAQVPTAAYGIVLLMSGLAFTILRNALLSAGGPDTPLARVIGDDLKPKISLALYAAAIGLAFVHSLLALTLIVIVAIMWLIPSRRVERALRD
ncbi:MAG TPA: TMEM175 family protein [Vicinamibacterales bacterium]|nr:TMEM175 family protein [Vicinamibacterales bacterium]